MSNYTQFAVPGLMTPHAPNFKSNIISGEAGNLIMLVHSGVATDCVHYCLVIGGRRFEGTIKDPTYPFVNGMDGREMDRNKFNKAPDFLYKTTDLPDEVYIPRINIKGCPTPITELNKAQDKVYFILKLPRTTLPQGDTLIQVTVNGKLRQYIVQRPTFFIHVPPCRDISNHYVRMNDTPEARFNVELDQNQESKISIDTVNQDLTGESMFGALLSNANYGEIQVPVEATIDYKEVVVTIPSALPAGHYFLQVSYKRTADQEQPERLINGYVEIKEKEMQQLEAEAVVDSYVELEYKIPELIRASQAIYGTIETEGQQNPTELNIDITQNGIAFITPDAVGRYIIKIYIYSLEEYPMQIINLILTVQ